MAATNQGKGIIIMGTANDTVAGKQKIKKAIWSGATTAGHTLVMDDVDGDIWLGLSAGATPNASIVVNFGDEGIWIDGPIVDTIASGTLYLYTE